MIPTKIKNTVPICIGPTSNLCTESRGGNAAIPRKASKLHIRCFPCSSIEARYAPKITTRVYSSAGMIWSNEVIEKPRRQPRVYKGISIVRKLSAGIYHPRRIKFPCSIDCASRIMLASSELYMTILLMRRYEVKRMLLPTMMLIHLPEERLNRKCHAFKTVPLVQ